MKKALRVDRTAAEQNLSQATRRRRRILRCRILFHSKHAAA